MHSRVIKMYIKQKIRNISIDTLVSVLSCKMDESLVQGKRIFHLMC